PRFQSTRYCWIDPPHPRFLPGYWHMHNKKNLALLPIPNKIPADIPHWGLRHSSPLLFCWTKSIRSCRPAVLLPVGLHHLEGREYLLPRRPRPVGLLPVGPRFAPLAAPASQCIGVRTG